MKPQLEEALAVLRMAGRDLKALEVLAASDEVHFSILCFHAQQVVEKCLKAVLYCHEVEFRRTHDLDLLAALVDAQGLSIPLSREDLGLLSPCAVRLRYDDLELDVELLSLDQLWQLAQIAFQWATVEIEKEKS
jgi:HEPN domain-containing protein